MSKVNIMHLLFSLDIGGLETFVLSLLKKMDRSSFNFSVCSMSAGTRLRSEFEQIGIPVFVAEKRQGIDHSLALRLGKFLRRERIHIVHTHNNGPWLYGGVAAKLTGAHLVHTEHSNPFSDRRKVLFGERCLAKITDTIISDSSKVANFMIHKQKIEPRKIETILNGVDVEMFQRNIDITAKRAEFQIGGNELVIGSVGRLVPVKDYLTLLKTFKIIVSKMKNCRLVILGDGVLRAELEAYTETEGLSQNVIFLGSRRDVPEIMPIFDVFTLSSLSEGLPIAILEAMATGVPVVATRVGGVPEVVVDGRTGLLVPPRNPEKLAEAIISILFDRGKIQLMGAAGRLRIEEKFNLTNTARSYEQVYHKVNGTVRNMSEIS